jgi:hypothetical protein
MAKKFYLFLFISLAAISGFAQTNPPKYFSSYVYTQDDLATGFDQGLFNPANSGKTIYIDRVNISVGFDADDTTPYVEFGTQFALTYPSNCTAYGVTNIDLSDAGQQTPGGTSAQSVAKFFGQPCLGPVNTGNLGATAGTYIDHFACMVNKSKNSCTLDLTAHPLAIPPGRGYVIYNLPGFKGTPIFGFEWHEQ